ncbi:MAG: NADH-ubiquinone oxidoreductase-F iron-sulfur binding region domain-containing protein [Thermomicrobiales bacterium]
MLKSPAEFKAHVEATRARIAEERDGKWVVTVAVSEDSVAKGVRDVLATLERELERLDASYVLRTVGSGGWAWADPSVEIESPDGPAVLYGNITPERAEALAASVAAGRYHAEWSVGTRADEPFQGHQPLTDHPFFGRQRRILFRDAGVVDPESIDEYIANGGYSAFVKAITEMTPDEVIEEVATSNVRGRGGAGFPAGIKWAGGRDSQANPKYIVVNSHEGEPNVYKDRRLIESCPHQLLEGIMIACYAIGAKVGYNYIGGEHFMAVDRFRLAVEQAYALGLLGDDVLGTGVNVQVRTRLGSGAYIAGEEMALLESLEGKQAMPRTKPPFPTVIGYLSRPTVLNNAETLSNIPHIINNGGAWYAGIGTERSKGTKLVTMQGRTERSGVVEVEMGMTLYDLVFNVYGGMQEGYEFAGLQTGGVSAGPVTRDMLKDYLVDFDSLRDVGGMLGSGGYVLFDNTVDPVEFALYLTEFSRWESCGKCTPCRLGCPALVEILRRIVNGQGRHGDLELIERHSKAMIELSLCGLGKAAPAPVLGFLQYYRAEFEKRIYEKSETDTAPAELVIVPNPAAAIPSRHRLPIYGQPSSTLGVSGDD